MAKPVAKTHILATTGATAVALTLVLVTIVSPGWGGYELRTFTGENGTVKYGAFYAQLCVPEDDCTTMPLTDTWDWSGDNDQYLKVDQLRMSYSVLRFMLPFSLLTLCLVLEVWALRTSSWKHSSNGLVMIAFSTTACMLWDILVPGIVYSVTSKMRFDDFSPRVNFQIKLGEILYKQVGVVLSWNYIPTGIAALLTTVMALFFSVRFMGSKPQQTEDNEFSNLHPPGDKEQVPVSHVHEQSVSL